MVGAARRGRRKAAGSGLLTAALVACASAQNPPGGPPDFSPPVLLEISPDSGTANPDLDGELRFTFDEVIDERSAGGLENIFRFSPRDENLKVRWHRKSIGIRPGSGWRPNTVYHVEMDSTISDLRRNRFGERRTVIFTTGGEIPSTSISGTVIDWEAGRAAIGALIEAILAPDSLVYTTRTDSVGDFELRAVPPGDYTVFAVLDANNSGMRERRESFDSLPVNLETVASADFWAIPHDTLGPRIRGVRLVDSVTVSVEFSQPLDPYNPDSIFAGVRELPDSTPVGVARVVFKSVSDSLVAVARAAADSARRDSLAALDTLPAAAEDTVSREEVRPELPDQQEEEVDADSTRAMGLLATRPALENIVVLALDSAVTPGSRYVVDARIRNVTGAVGESRTVLVVPEAPEPEEDLPADSIQATPERPATPDSLPVDSLPARPR